MNRALSLLVFKDKPNFYMNNRDDLIATKLDILIRLTAISILRDLPFKERVRMLSAAGLQPKEIGEILNRTSNQVRVTLVDIRKEGKKNE